MESEHCAGVCLGPVSRGIHLHSYGTHHWFSKHSTNSLTLVAACNNMSSRGRSPSARPLDNGDVDMTNDNAKFVIVSNLTRNVVEDHLRTIFSFYGEISKVELPVYGKCAQQVHNLFLMNNV